MAPYNWPSAAPTAIPTSAPSASPSSRSPTNDPDDTFSPTAAPTAVAPTAAPDGAGAVPTALTATSPAPTANRTPSSNKSGGEAGGELPIWVYALISLGALTVIGICGFCCMRRTGGDTPFKGGFVNPGQRDQVESRRRPVVDNPTFAATGGLAADAAAPTAAADGDDDSIGAYEVAHRLNPDYAATSAVRSTGQVAAAAPVPSVAACAYRSSDGLKCKGTALVGGERCRLHTCRAPGCGRSKRSHLELCPVCTGTDGSQRETNYAAGHQVSTTGANAGNEAEPVYAAMDYEQVGSHGRPQQQPAPPYDTVVFVAPGHYAALNGEQEVHDQFYDRTSDAHGETSA